MCLQWTLCKKSLIAMESVGSSLQYIKLAIKVCLIFVDKEKMKPESLL